MKFEVTENPGAEWDLFVEKHTDMLFYSSVWGEVLKQGLGGRPCYMYLRDADGIACGMAGVSLKYYGIKLYYSSIPYGGYIGDKALFSEFADRFVEKSKFADIVYLSSFSPEMDQAYSSYFKATAEAATRIDLKGRAWSDVASCFEPSVRQSINKGARLGLEVSRCVERESFLIAHRLYLQTMRRNKAIARYSERWFLTLHSVLAGKGRASVYLVRHSGVPVSATVVIESKRVSHLLHSGSSTEHLSLRANDVVVCEIIKDCFNAGKESVDLMLSDSSDTALIRWKEKFGGRTVMLNKYSGINRPLKYSLWSTAKKIYPLLLRSRESLRTW